MRMQKMKTLTKTEKTRILTSLNDQIADGNVDREIIPYLKIINSFKNICTTQSCTGHKDKEGYQSDGHLRLRLSRTLIRLLEKNVSRFYECPFIEFVDKRYFPAKKWQAGLRNDNDEIYEEIMIDFLGLNRSKSHFESSLKQIIRVLRTMQVKN